MVNSMAFTARNEQAKSFGNRNEANKKSSNDNGYSDGNRFQKRINRSVHIITFKVIRSTGVTNYMVILLGTNWSKREFQSIRFLLAWMLLNLLLSKTMGMQEFFLRIWALVNFNNWWLCSPLIWIHLLMQLLRQDSPSTSYMAGICLSVSLNPMLSLASVWIADSGSSRHICFNANAFLFLKPITNSRVTLANNVNIPVSLCRNVRLSP